MANQKPKKADKPSTKPEASKGNSTPATQTVCAAEPSLKGFFARKCDKDENVFTIFKSPRIWGALLGELIGTMLIVMLFLTLGLQQPLYVVVALIGVYITIVGLSGANLNPLVTVGMMATRRMSAIRGVLYILAQVLGAWLGLIVINAFRLGSGVETDLPMMTEITGDTFWATALVELLGSIIIAFCFARALRYSRKSPVTFALTVTSGITMAYILAILISGGYFSLTKNFIMNPAAALMYQILPTTAENFGELAGIAGLALAAYIVVPMVGGVIGFFISDFSTKLAGDGYSCDDTKCCKEA